MLPQLHQFLGEPPGNVVYHLVTLLALQAAFGLGLSQWRRARAHSGDPLPPLTRRLVWGTGAILLLRLALLGTILFLSDRGDLQPALRLPPLESAIDLATAVLLVWIISPAQQRPQMANALVALGLLVTAVLYIFFAAQWPSRAITGLAFDATLQATLWTSAQMLVWATGATILLLTRPVDAGLRLGLPLVMLLAHIAALVDRLLSTSAAVEGWLRLGYLVTLPLLALIAYRYALRYTAAGRAPFADSARGWPALSTLLQADSAAMAQQAALPLLHATLPLAWAGVAYAGSDGAPLDVVGSADIERHVDSFALDAADIFPTGQLAGDGRLFIAKPEGPGSRQWHAITHPPAMEDAGTLLILRLEQLAPAAGALLLLARAGDGWPVAEKRLALALGGVVAHALRGAANPIAAGDDLATLQDALRTALAEQNRIELDLQREKRRAQDLAAALAEIEGEARPAEVQTLEAEVIALRESLLQAEEAMAMVAASQEEISPEWVTQTISRYSAELEAAEAQIGELERQLEEQDRVRASSVLLALIQELRTPMTSIAGYTDLLLAEKAGQLGVRQRHFLQRVDANIERMQTLLHQINHLTGENRQLLLAPPEILDVRDVVEAAIEDVLAQIREKGLRLDSDIPDDLPRISANRQVLYEVVTHLLQNACHASRANGRITVSLRVNPGAANGQNEPIRFLQLSVADSGAGIRIEDRPHIFDYRYHAENPLISGLGDRGAALPLARTLVAAHGGRIWVDSERGVGTTISVLLPISTRRLTQPLSDG